MLDTLQEAGFKAYLVGGGVRDLLLKLNPKDFDIATEARPEQIKELFGRSCRLIGRRFRLAHVRMGREIVEVATFRAAREAEEEDDGERLSVNGRIVRDNVYGTLEEDASRAEEPRSRGRSVSVSVRARRSKFERSPSDVLNSRIVPGRSL